MVNNVTPMVRSMLPGGVVQMFDSLVNLITGMGTSDDKAMGKQFSYRVILRNELEAMYRSDWVSRKVVDIPAFDMTRRGRDWQAEQEQITAIENAEKALGLWAKVGKAIRWARLYGGAAIIINDGGNPSTPLRPESAAKDRIKALHVVSRWRLNIPDSLSASIATPELFGKPKFFELNTSEDHQLRIDPSRVVTFHGQPVPDTDNVDDYWGDSILQAVYDAVQQAAGAPQGFSAMIDDAKTDIIKIKDLPSQLQTSQLRNKLIDRWTLFRLQKYLNKVSLMDMDSEEFVTHQMSFTGQAELINAYMVLASGAADIPATRMLGQSPTGLNATGESDLRNYYNSVESRQENELRPALDYLDQFVVPHALGSMDKEIWYKFTPLWTPTEVEQATIDKTKAETVGLYASSPLVNQAALQKGVEGMLVDDGLFPGFEQALIEFEKFNPKPEDLIASLNEPEEDQNAEGEEKSEPDDADEEKKDPKTTAQDVVQDARPRTLYIQRKVLNPQDIIKWAKSQGFKTTLEPSDLHVTVCFSRQPVDWLKMPLAYEDEIKVVGGPRLMERLGADAVVLLFNAPSLQWRHRELKEAGASWDHPEYQPHITISYNTEGMEIEKIEPYQGLIRLGPEVWEEVNEDFKSEVKEV